MDNNINSLLKIGLIVFLCIGIVMAFASTMPVYTQYIIVLLMAGFMAGVGITLVAIQMFYKK